MQKLETGTNELLCYLNDAVATISINRPEKRNALGDTLTPALRETLLRLEGDERVRVIVITGVGTSFCAGGDVKSMNNQRPDRSSIEEKIRNLQNRQKTLALRLYELSKPTIAALPGAAAGAGMSIALACDLRIGSSNSFFAPGYARIGLSGDYGISYLLTNIVGPAKAKELMFTGRYVRSDEALSLGLLNEIVTDDALTTRTDELAKQISDGPPIAIQYMKENINRSLTANFKICLDYEADRLVRVAQTEDHKEGIRAFLEKRSPLFQGK